ncbi:hypothetical protein V1478_002687 [Vespula squamosa]|uniref:Uncharacterized protein n=1 Tax=Vespula squamosa TaxID=30214 RepID=A0ABD2BT94_VESSQ
MVYEPGVLTGLYGAKASVMCHCRRSTVSEWLSRTCSGGGASVVARRTGRLTGGWLTGGGKAWGNTSVVAGEGATRAQGSVVLVTRPNWSVAFSSDFLYSLQ